MMEGLSPEELAFMGTLEGAAAIARSRRDFDLREGWKGSLAQAWGPGNIAAAVRSGFLEHQRAQFAAATERAGEAYRQGEGVALRAMRNAAYAARTSTGGSSGR